MLPLKRCGYPQLLPYHPLPEEARPSHTLTLARLPPLPTDLALQRQAGAQAGEEGVPRAGGLQVT